MASTERLIIVGAGGFGREILCWAEDCHRAGTLPAVAGFLDDKVEALPNYGVSRVGTVADYGPQPGDVFVVAVGEPGRKKEVVDSLQGRGARFAQLVHPSCTITKTASLGEGVIMCPQTMAMPDARIERFVTIINFSGIGHDSVAGEFSTLSSLVDVTGNVRIGAGVTIGSGARILPGVTIGDGATIGAGAIVMRSVKPGTTVYAAPAKLLRTSPRPVST